MDRVSLSHAETHFADLVDRVSRGEEIQIVNDGETVARLAPPKRPIPPENPQPFDWDAVEAMTHRMTPQTENAGEFFERMRDSERY